MLLSQRPLTPAEGDLNLAVGSRVLLAKRICRNAVRHRNSLLLGARGSGRTSSLSIVESQLRAEPSIRIVRVDGEACRQAEDLVSALMAALGSDPRGPTKRTLPSKWSSALAPDFFVGQTVEARWVNETDAARIADLAAELVTNGSFVVVLIDNLDPVAAYDVFGRFRDAFWAAPVVWIGAGDGDRSGYLNPPADVFWESVEWLEPLTGHDVSEMLTRRIEAAGPADTDAITVSAHLGKLVELLDEATPREVIRAAAEVADSGSIGDAFGSIERFGRAHAAGGRRASMLLAEIERLGRPVHAGDEELLSRIGLTRPRVIQLMVALESAGLVTRRRDGKRVLFEAKP
jgi:DNA-binding transcriptional ArsR family regulator